MRDDGGMFILHPASFILPKPRGRLVIGPGPSGTDRSHFVLMSIIQPENNNLP